MKAMILAAGRGERMRPLTDHCPKPLLCAGGKPLLQWHIEALVNAGICDIVINHAHLGHQIESFFGDGAAWGAKIRYSPEAAALETGGGIRQALPLLGLSPFLVLNGDIACEWPVIKALQIERTWQPAQLAHLVMVPNPPHNMKGDFSLLNKQLMQADVKAGTYTFSGIGVYHPDLFAALGAGEVAKLAPLLRQAIDTGKVGGELFDGFWMDIGTPERLNELQQRLNSKRTKAI